MADARSWRAVVRGSLIAEWRVYADNEPIRQIVGQASWPVSSIRPNSAAPAEPRTNPAHAAP